VHHQLPRRRAEVRHEAGDVVIEPARRPVGHPPHGRHALLEHPADHPSFLLNHSRTGKQKASAVS
jgi:hypothetical protein